MQASCIPAVITNRQTDLRHRAGGIESAAREILAVCFEMRRTEKCREKSKYAA